MTQDNSNKIDDLLEEHNIRFCVLNGYRQVSDALVETLDCSKNKVKKYYIDSIQKPKSPECGCIGDLKLEQSLDAKAEINVSLNLANHKDVYPRLGAKLNVVYEDQFFLVINKPSKMHSVPLKYLETDNILSSIRGNKKYSYLNTVNYPDLNRGLINRLDFHTSGLLIFVKDLEVFQDLRDNFNSLVKEKVYFAWIEGNLDYNGKVKGYLKPKGPKGEKMVFLQEEESGALYSESEFITKEYDAKRDRTFVHIKIITGARHQIRVHAQHLGHPIVGDPLYSHKTYNRLLLHASRYVLERNGRKYTFNAPCPFDIPELLAR